MLPIAFDEENVIFDKPSSMSADDCEAISAWKGTDKDGKPMVITCWKLTKEELEEINKTGRVWLYVLGGGMPPVSLQVSHPFNAGVV